MVSALGQSSISGVTEGAETRGGSSSTGTSSSKPYEFGRREARRDAGIASARRAGRIGGASEQGALSRNYASKGDDLSEALRGAIEGNGRSRYGTFLGINWAAAVGDAGFFKTHWYDGPHPLGAVD